MKKERNLTNVPTHSVLCTVCKKLKDYKSFTYYTSRFTSDGLRLRVNTNCLECQKKLSKERSQVKKKAPPKPEVCDICHKIPPNDKNWQLDHDHKTGEFSGWLCKDCNVGLGKLGDTASKITKAWMYAMKKRSDVSFELISEVFSFIKELESAE